MNNHENTAVKIAYKFYSDVLDEWTVETLWADVINAKNGLYKLGNIPFYAPVACGDIVLAKYNEDEERLVYEKTVEHSGNSTIQVVIMDKTVVTNEIRNMFSELGFESEKFNEGYFVMEIPADKDYSIAKQKLQDLENLGTIGYAEPCLSENHQY